MQETKYCLNKEINLNRKLFRIFCFVVAAASCTRSLCSLINNISDISSGNTTAILYVVSNILAIATNVPIALCGIKATDAHSKEALKFLKIYFYCEAVLNVISILIFVYHYFSLPKSSTSVTYISISSYIINMCIIAIYIFTAISLSNAKLFKISRFFVLALALLSIYSNGSYIVYLLKSNTTYNIIYSITNPVTGVISSVSLTLLLFVGIKVHVPIEQQFAALTEKYQAGSITKLDYERQREKLLKKL